jgi:hypothetical protein
LNGAFTFDSIRYCYALPDLKIGPAGTEAAITSSDANNIDGADITLDALTEDFYTGIGWAFGNTLEAPWVWNENGKLRLWYEYLVSSIALDNSSAHIDVAESLQLTAHVYPQDAKNRQVSWTSSDPEVATVEENGLVTGLKFGSATISVTTEEGGFTATCVVQVGIAETLALNKNELTLKESEEEILTVDILPEEATYTDVSWRSTAPEIAAVNAGKVSALAKGECLVIVTLNNSNLSDTCKVTVRSGSALLLPDAGRDVLLVNTDRTLEISAQQAMEQVTVFDVNGKTVYISPEKKSRMLISTAQWNPGIYVVKITTGDTVLYRKLPVR